MAPSSSINENAANQWKTINAKVREQDLPILNSRLKVYGYQTIGEIVKDFVAGKFPQVTDDKQIDMINKQATGQLTLVEGRFDPTFYKNINYEDMKRYFIQLRKYSPSYARQLVSYFRLYADEFFCTPEKLHELTPRKRAWVLGAMRSFGVYY